MNNFKNIVFASSIGLLLLGCTNQQEKEENTEAYKLPSLENLRIRYEPITGIGPEENVVRRDPSDIIFIKGLYYVWYTKVTIENYGYPEGFQGTIWYATSPDGINWKEMQKVLDTGQEGKFDDYGVYTPNIIYSPKNKEYYLYYTGVKKLPEGSGRVFSRGTIGVAVADHPDGGSAGWKRGNGGKPVLRTMDHISQNKFGSTHVDDVCMLFKNERYYMYHKGIPSAAEKDVLNLPRGTTPMGMAISDRPDSAFTPQLLDSIQGFLVRPGHEVLLWRHGKGLAVLPAGHYRPKTESDFHVHYSEDGIHFNVIGNEVINIREGDGGIPSNGLRAPGAYRPDLINPDTIVTGLKWGLSMTSYQDGAGLQRFVPEYY
ncbi:hypothetical protein ACFLU5_16000 [Bacteroidota bacterium]